MEKAGSKGTKRLQLATEIAKMYYLEHMTQEQIAKITHQSRPNVSRILSQCTESQNHVKTITRHIWEDYIEICEDIRKENISSQS